MSVIARVADTLMELPARSNLIFRVARRIVFRHRGENDSRMWRNGEIRLLRKVLPGAKVVFDVGANVGEWALQALAIDPTIDLHCFEPDRRAFEQLERAVPGATLNNVGLGAASGHSSLHIYGDGASENSLYERKGAGLRALRSETIPITTLDQYAADIPRIDFLKIDVEGHECAVLEGAGKLLSEHRICGIQFEYSACYMEGRRLLRDIWDILEPAGYRIFKILPHGLLPIAAYDQSFENYQLANYFATLPNVEKFKV